MTKKRVHIFWFRRDLRLNDNHGLFQALSQSDPVLPIFIFDTEILEQLPSRSDRRVDFIHQALQKLRAKIRETDSDLLVKTGKPLEVFKEISAAFDVQAIYCNTDYEPYARKRDDEVAQWAGTQGIRFSSFKDQVIFEKDEVLKKDGKPYTVFTPYARMWRSTLTDAPTKFPSEQHIGNFLKIESFHFPSLKEIGFEKTDVRFSEPEINTEILRNYAQKRDVPFGQNTSRLGVHLRFGTVSIRELYRCTVSVSDVFVNELIWREFYQMILWHFPHVEHRSFKPAYDQIPWHNSEADFELWKSGKTGYPLVDAGMRELLQTGFMHNRVRMLSASFLTKHLLIDWRWGEAWFAQHLLDFELASNNGGWQWAAGSGCDAAPYFRIFNPHTQLKKFDPELNYVRQFLPEFDSLEYPQPMVEHSFARNRALEVYKNGLST
jgi:deoxyribodipyrimidine photo-lyase